MDLALDAALAKYSAVEPRAGLEQRIMANLKAQTAISPVHVWWRWAVAIGSFAIVCFVAAYSWNLLTRPHPIASDPAKEIRSAPEAPKQPVKSAIQANIAPPSPQRKGGTHAMNPVVVPRTPRLNQFPNPQPLTPEEVALARYVAQFPAEATLIAQAQEEYAKESEQKMGISRPDTHSSLEEER